MREWQSIDTAPRDGTEIYIMNDDQWAVRARYIVGSSNVAAYCWESPDAPNIAYSENEFTLWLPLPAAPSEAVQVSEDEAK